MTWIRRALALSTLAGAALVAVPLSASAQDAPPDPAARPSAADDAARHDRRRPSAPSTCSATSRPATR